MPAKDPSSSARMIVEDLIDEIAVNTDVDDEDTELAADVLADMAKDEKQEDLWYQIANAIGITELDLEQTAERHGLESPTAARDAAYAGAGEEFPRRGSWSGELVWLFLTLRDRGLVDVAGEPASVREEEEPKPDQLELGIKTEMEHTDDPKVAEKIARDHLAEDPDYYTKLLKAGL